MTEAARLSISCLNIWRDASRSLAAIGIEVCRASSAMAVADYRGLKVSEMQAVRRTLRENNVQLTIAKNRLLKIAADEAERPELKPMLFGNYEALMYLRQVPNPRLAMRAEEIAEYLGVPVGTVKAWIRRELVAMRRQLE